MDDAPEELPAAPQASPEEKARKISRQVESTMAPEGQPTPSADAEEVYRRSLANEKAKPGGGDAKGDTGRDASSVHPRSAGISTVGDESLLVQRREVRVALELHQTVADLLRSDRCEDILAIGRHNICRLRETPRAPSRGSDRGGQAGGHPACAASAGMI